MRRALHFCARGAGDRGPWMPVLCGFWPGSLVVERVNSLHSSALPVQCSGNGPGTDCYCAVLRPLTGIPEDGRLLDPTIVETETETETATQNETGTPHRQAANDASETNTAHRYGRGTVHPCRRPCMKTCSRDTVQRGAVRHRMRAPPDGASREGRFVEVVDDVEGCCMCVSSLDDGAAQPRRCNVCLRDSGRPDWYGMALCQILPCICCPQGQRACCRSVDASAHRARRGGVQFQFNLEGRYG